MTNSPTTILTSASTQNSSYVSTSPPKRKRRPAGTPDPDAEVIALSPKTLMESDRYVCEICNQGFQRDQNLQMHRRRHKVPWKLLKRADPEVKKRVYVCPETSCLHHDPCHALGDLVGIKKHYRRKHSSMKQWECDKCSKAYAVQSDYKAHLKTCGTRGHCCDCGRVFSRVESFIEHQDSCTVARNKRGVASMSEQQATSLPSLAAAPVDHHHHHHHHHHHASLMPTNPSSSAEKVIKKDSHHHTVPFNRPLQSLTNDQECGVSALPILPYMQSAYPAHVLGPVVTNAHTSVPLPITSPGSALPSFLLAAILPPQAPPSVAVTPPVVPECAKLSWEIAASDGPNLLRVHQKAELQLLPTKVQSSQIESSQSSNVCNWPVTKDINSTNSTTSATICSSPSEKSMDQKQAPNVSSGLPSDIVPCKLQLSIGFIHDEHRACNIEGSTSLPDHEATHAKAIPCNIKSTNMPWPARGTIPATGHGKHHDTHSNKQSSPYTPPKKQAIIGHDKEAIGLELATGAWCAGRDTSQDMSSLEIQRKQDHDYFSCKKSAACKAVSGAGYGDGPEGAATDERRQRPVDDNEELRLGSLKRCNSSSGLSGAVAAAADQQQPKVEGQPSLLSRQINIVESGEAHQHLDLSIDRAAQPQLAAEREAELRLQRAREKLKWALEEKVEAERAWKELAKREMKEQAEASELAGMKRSAARDYNTRADDEEGRETRKSNLKFASSSSPSSLTLSHSLAAMSSSSCQVSTSAASLQMQLNAGGVLISGSTFITCPSCHHTQILYHPANLRGTLFVPSQDGSPGAFPAHN